MLAAYTVIMGTFTGTIIYEQEIARLRARIAQLQAELEAVNAGRAGAPTEASSKARTSEFELGDIIDSGAVQALAEDFYAVAGIPFSVLDINGKVLVGAGWQDICTKFHRVHPGTCANCIESDTRLSAGVPPGECRLYKCRNNMWDVASPLFIGGRHVGNLFSGQFFFEDELVDENLFRLQARTYGFDEAEYLNALARVPRLSRTCVDRAMAFFIKFGHMLSLLSYRNLELARSVSQRDALTVSLQQNGEILNRAEQIAQLGSWQLDITHNLLSWSDEVYRIFGLKPQQFGATYEAFLEAVHPDDRERVNEAYSSSIRNGRNSYEIAHRIVRSDTGAVHWVYEKCEHIRDAAGAIVRSIGMVHDITERRSAEERIQHQNAVLIAINRIFAEALRCETDEELGQTCLAIAGQLTESTFGCLCETVADGDLELIAVSNGTPTDAWATDLRKLCRGMIDEKGQFCCATLPSRSGAFGTDRVVGVPLIHGGTITGAIVVGGRDGGYETEHSQALEAVAGAIVEVLTRRRAEESLRASEARERARAAELEAIMDAVPAAVFIAREPECGVVLGNRFTYELLDVPAGTNLSKSPQAADTPASVRFVKEGREFPVEDLPIQRAAWTGKPASDIEFDVICGDGKSRQLFGNAVPLLDGAGRAYGSIAAFIDITELKRVEEQLRHAQKLESIGVLAGGVAHDFNNILTSILGNASLLQMDLPATAQRRLETIIESTERAGALTRQLLAYAGKGRFHVCDFDISALVRSTADLLRVSIPKNVELIIEVPRMLPVTRGDSSQIQQVLMNLVLNAAEAIPDGKGGRVAVTASSIEIDAAFPQDSGCEIAPGWYICVNVTDNGCGIDEETKRRIFEPFFTTKFTGRGLGLAAVQGILRSHKGGITLQTSPGQGSTFAVYLPCTTPQASAVTGSTRSAEAGEATTVLVVDDEAAVRTFSEAALECLGYNVVLAENGRAALEALRSNRGIDLVLLDLVMPVMGGAEAFAAIRKEWPNIAVLLSSGYSRHEADRLGLPQDVPILEKPYSVQNLKAALGTALKRPATADR